MILAFFEWLFTKRFGGHKLQAGDGLRQMLGNRCPICGKSVNAHRFAEVASFLIGSDEVSSVAESRRRILTEASTHLPHEFLPHEDAMLYYLIACPQVGKVALLEIVSRAGMYGSDYVQQMKNASQNRLQELSIAVVNWTQFT